MHYRIEYVAMTAIDTLYITAFNSEYIHDAAVERFREHYPYSKKFETTVAHTGRERLIGTDIETLGTEVAS